MYLIEYVVHLFFLESVQVLFNTYGASTTFYKCLVIRSWISYTSL